MGVSGAARARLPANWREEKPAGPGTERSAPHWAGRSPDHNLLLENYLYMALIVLQVVSSTGVGSQCSV